MKTAKYNMHTVRYHEVLCGEEGQRIDNYLFRELRKVPKSMVYRIVRKGEVRVNSKRISASYRVQVSDIIRIPPIKISISKVKAVVTDDFMQKMENAILYEDNSLIVVDKPAGLAVHGGSGVSLGLIEIFRKLRGDAIELVHRIDRETSGCLLLAKRRSALRSLHAVMRAGDINKVYYALVSGMWPDKDLVRASLKKILQASGERRVIVSLDGKDSQTRYRILKKYSGATLVEVKPITGRTHQIRVHCAHMGHPILGDEKYGGREDNQKFNRLGLSRMFLHAQSLEFSLPGDDKRINIEAPLSDRLKRVLECIPTLK